MIDKTAIVSKKAKIGKNVQIWAFAQIREGVVIGNNCIIGSHVYIDHDVEIGSNCKIENNAQMFFGATIEDEVFIGPGVYLLNDKYPRAVNRSGKLKKVGDWEVDKILVKKGASIGAAGIILPGVTIGSYSMVGAGSVVTKSLPDFSLAFGKPTKVAGFVCKQGHKLEQKTKNGYFCPICKEPYKIKNEKK